MGRRAALARRFLLCEALGMTLSTDQALNAAQGAANRGDLNGAADILAAAFQRDQTNPLIPLLLAQIHRAAGSDEGEAESLAIALAIDPYCWPALLARGSRHERQGRPREAAQVWRDALRIAPPKSHWPPLYAGELAHAEREVSRFTQALEAQLLTAIDGADGRWREAAAIMAGRTRPYHVDCNQLTVPRLPAIPFFDPAEFAWSRALEAQTDAIRAELIATLNERKDAYAPYIHYRPGEPVNQWGDLNHSLRWSTFDLWKGGVAQQVNQAACPVTTAALQAVELCDIDGLCPNAMFSALAPHTEIPPHHGETNARLVVHLPLIVPENCRYRVGFEERGWEEGRLLIFDDSIEHTARNDSDHLRVVLIFDVWNPLLSLEERQIVQALVRANRAFRTG